LPSGKTFKWGYGVSYATRTVGEKAGPVEKLDTAGAHAAALTVQSLARGRKVRTQPRNPIAARPELSEKDLIAQAGAGAELGKVGVNDLNRCILQWSIDQIDKVVDRGECWDLAMHAAKESGGEFPWGDRCTIWSNDEVSPAECKGGDIIQMFSQRWESTDGSWMETGPVHTAIVVENLGGGEKIRCLHCNWGGDKTVQYIVFPYGSATSGRSVFYRPNRTTD